MLVNGRRKLRLFRTIAGLWCYLQRLTQPKVVSLIPLNEASCREYISLIQRTQRQSNTFVISIFVYLQQLASTSDTSEHPNQLDKGIKLCELLGIDTFFAPSVVEFYGQQPAIEASQNQHLMMQVIAPASTTSVCSDSLRPGYWQDLATLATRLFNIVQPTTVYFREKDAQQLAIIRRLAVDLNFPVKIVSSPVARQESGLACSCKNQYLTEQQTVQAPMLHSALQQAKKTFQSGERDCAVLIEVVKSELAIASDIEVEYIELVHPKTLIPLDQVKDTGLLAVTARLGSTFLTDNVLLAQRKPIVAIDGPAGAGKSTVTRQVANTLQLMHLDTGAMYRAITWRIQKVGISLEDEPAIAELVSQSQIYLTNDEACQTGVRVWIDGEEVTQVIRSLEVTANVSAVSAIPAVRRELVKQQRRWGSLGGIVAEGRDIGTNVFPDAELKIFLTASVEERARRRQKDLEDQKLAKVSLEQLEHDIQQRDFRDSSRTLSPLRKAVDAIEIQTDGLSIPEVTKQIVSLYHQKVLN
ncbi:bifunctional pantoate--beta-alanine ligase/(d)CMP kinase [Lyngbya aestuarii]|uniref:bifunctional pantoate--beta-alanine ligase/(d)CMP kinase n=1 Tax=Lyngbya aestuarii TaxID=118322 RepID=UPI00403D9FA7